MNPRASGQRRITWIVGIAGALLLGIIMVSALAPTGETGYEPGPDLRPADSGAAAQQQGTDDDGGGNSGASDEDIAADDPTPQAFSLGPGDLLSLAWRLGLVILIIGLSIVALRWWARKSSGPTSSTGFLRVVDTLSVGNGRTIHLVALGERIIVVGATQQSLSYLNELSADESGQVNLDAERGHEQPFGGFAAQLMDNLRSGRTARYPGDQISLEETK